MAKDYSDSEKGNPLPPHRLLLSIRAMGRRIDPSWGGPIELCLVPASAPRLV